jgi:hypothetical protein
MFSALDAIDWLEMEKEHKSLKSDVTKFLKASRAARVETHPSVGLGTDCRLESKKVAGFALAIDDPDPTFVRFRPDKWSQPE